MLLLTQTSKNPQDCLALMVPIDDLWNSLYEETWDETFGELHLSCHVQVALAERILPIKWFVIYNWDRIMEYFTVSSRKKEQLQKEFLLNRNGVQGEWKQVGHSLPQCCENESLSLRRLFICIMDLGWYGARHQWISRWSWLFPSALPINASLSHPTVSG